MLSTVITTGSARAPSRDIVRSHFDLQAAPPGRQLLAWRERVGHVIDVVPSLSDIDKPFRASIERYQVGKLVLTDCRSDAMVLERSLGRISRDSVRDFVFQVFLEGGVDNVAMRATPCAGADTRSVASILALDMSQPVRMRRHACRVITFFVPGDVVQETFPDPEAIHGRTIHGTTPMLRLIIEHVTSLVHDIAGLSADAAESAISKCAQLLAAAFGKQALLSGNARAAARAAMSGCVRRYVRAHLFDSDLSPDTLLHALGLPRQTLYRLFKHEGGLAAYIRHVRLREATERLAHNPLESVTFIAFDLGFKSSTDFTRAFRRAYDMTPLDFRMQARESSHTRLTSSS